MRVLTLEETRMQTDEHTLDRAAGGGPTADRAADAQRRALEALARMIPGDDGDDLTDDTDDLVTDGEGARRAPEVVIDLTDDATGHRWATAAKAARLAGISPSVVRQWARHGVVRRQHRDQGGYVVDVEAVLDTAIHAGTSDGPPSGHVLAKIMQLQRDRALDELRHVDREVEDAVVEIEFLRHQLDFAEAENRGLRLSLERCRQEARTPAAVDIGVESEADVADATGHPEEAPAAEDDGATGLSGFTRRAHVAAAHEPVQSGPPSEPRLPLPPAVFSVLQDESGTDADHGRGARVDDDLTPADVPLPRRRRRGKRRV